MKLSIAYLNDVHGYLEPHPELFYKGGKEIVATAGGYARIATKIKDIRANSQHTLLFDGGDTFHGTLPLVASKGEAILPILNKMGFNAMTGHWDFAYGPVQLKKLASQLNYPVLGINVYNEKDDTLFLSPYIIIQIEDIKLAVIGICSNIIDKTMPAHFSEGLKVSDGVKELPLFIKQVKDKGADLVILLSHNGFPQDVAMLSNVAGVDVCLSAHTHNRLYEAIKVNDTIIIQCGCHGSFLGHLEIDIEQTKIRDYKYDLITITEDIKPDDEIESLVTDIMRSHQYLKEEILGNTSMILHRYNTLASAMDDLLLSAIKSISNAEIAFSNGWRYGAPVAAGKITRWDLYNIIPMNPLVSTVDLTGEEIMKMLEENLERTFSADAMKQMGGYVKRCLGLQVKMRIENPKYYRIQQIFIGDETLRKDQTYKVVFVTMQGVPEELGRNRRNLPVKAVDAIATFLINKPNFTATSANAFSLV